MPSVDGVARNRLQKYESVSLDETEPGEDVELFPNDEDNEELGRPSPRRMRKPPLAIRGGVVIFQNAKFVVGFLLVAFLIVFAGYKFTSNSAKDLTAGNGSKPSPKWVVDDDDNFDDDEVSSHLHRAPTPAPSGEDDFWHKAVGATSQEPVQYDLAWMKTAWNPFNLNSADGGENDEVWKAPTLPWTPDDSVISGYITQPDVANRLVVFVSEGDLYVTQYTRKTMSEAHPAVKLTTTVGNVKSPRLHPHAPLVAFTATYEGVREVYLQDLRKPTAVRLTFWDHNYGVSRVVGWQDDKTLLIAAYHTAVALPDIRLFALTLAQEDLAQQQTPERQHVVLEITPIPLSQAIDATTMRFHPATSSDPVDCYYFTRNTQSSNTLRYVGGTVEQLWAYCSGFETAVPLTTNYAGTSKSPTHWQSVDGQDYLLFASDRVAVGDGWTTGTMNIWAMTLPTPEELYSEAFTAPVPMVLTDFGCWQQGRTMQEYRVDYNKRNIVVRMGADLYEIVSSELDKRFDESKGGLPEPSQIGIQVLSDFHEMQERLIPLNLLTHWEDADVLQLPTGSIAMLLTLRGQSWMTPVLHDTSLSAPYQGAGQNMPLRRYRVAPGALTGGSMRVLKSVHIPLVGNDPIVFSRRLALVLATDPLSETAEHAFYLLEVQESAPSAFADLAHAPLPFLGGSVNGGSVKEDGLGSILKDSVVVSPCGRRVAWADTDGRICAMTLPLFHQQFNSTVTYTILPDYNELDEPMDGTLVDLAWSPGGRYLTISHVAANKFFVISLADCGDPLAGHVEMGRIVQATPSRFNSQSPYWGNKRVDAELAKYEILISQATGQPLPEDVSTTLYFLTDRDVRNDASSPWGHRAPLPHFPRHTLLYALPLTAVGDNGALDSNLPLGPFSGGAAMEIFAADIDALTLKIKGLRMSRLSGASDGSTRRLADASRKLAREAKRSGLAADSPKFERILKDIGPETAQETEDPPPNPFPSDMVIDFGPKDLSFARRAYRMAHVPESNYYDILAQTADDGSLLLVDVTSTYVASIKIFAADHYPYDGLKGIPLATPGARLVAWGESTDRQFVYIVLAPGNIVKVFKNALTDVAGFMSEMATGMPTTHIADVGGMALSVWPRLEYRQLFNDAWRLLRDYFYDTEMHQLDWPAIHERYVGLVGRCNKREELDDVLAQMAAELSALHVFVYGGEYASPFPDESVLALQQHASFGATLRRVAEWKGYEILEIPERDPDFNLVSGTPVYSPLSSQSLWQSGQKGLAVGDVIVGVNGESVFRVPDIHMLLRGMAGRSVRLEVLRLESGDYKASNEAIPEPVIVVPITQTAAANLRYNAWEYKSRELAKTLAGEAGFTVGYIHMRAMGSADINAFAQGFFEDYNKETLILDVRHNHGGNIDSWVSTMLQRAAWSYFGGRNTRFAGGDMDWDQQFAFRGHVVVLIDEHTSSDGEGVSRSISELGIGRLVGTRTWGGGIWLASDNKLVDGGIATAPEFAVYNDKFGWGMGIGT